MNDSTFCTFCTAKATRVVIDVDGDRSPLCATCAAVFEYAEACIMPRVISLEEYLGESLDKLIGEDEEVKDNE